MIVVALVWLALCGGVVEVQASSTVYEHRASYWCTGTIHGATFSGDAYIDWGRGEWSLNAVHYPEGMVCSNDLKRQCVEDADCRGLPPPARPVDGLCAPDPIEFNQTIKGAIHWVSDTEFEAKTAYAGGAVLRFTRDAQDNIVFQSSSVSVDFDECTQSGRVKRERARPVGVAHTPPQGRPRRPPPRERPRAARFPRFGDRH